MQVLRLADSEADLMVISVLGDLDLASVPAVRSVSMEVAADGWRHIIVDLGGVEFVDSAGMGALIGLRRRCRAEGGECVLAAALPAVLRMLEAADLHRIFPIFETIAEARGAVWSART